jgi:UDP-N-acetylmuramate-alanine ligase
VKVHLIAIGGSAMHNLAIALHDKGFVVTGSDDEIFEPSKSRLAARGILPAEIGWFPEKNRVYFDTTESEIVSESREEIRAIVPLDLASGEYTISVSVDNQNVAFDEYLFQLIVNHPEINN